ncbi:MAG: hypothetical protein U0U46_21645 [Saprospiraceae bacterium]
MKQFRFFLLSVALSFCAAGAFGQRTFGIGFQAGEPTGLALQFYHPGGVSADLLFAWNANDYFFASVHGLWHNGLDRAGRLQFYYGPGAFIRLQERGKKYDDDEVRLGLSGNFGLRLWLGRVDLFAQLTPRLALSPGTDLDLGGGVGARFFF